MADSRSFFSSKADDYANYRPQYSAKAIEFIRTKMELKPGSVVADIGSGTGIFSRQLLDNEFAVYSVEPNEEMRKQAESTLDSYEGFQSISGDATNTSLPDQFVELITAAQALHWFDLERGKREFLRILKPCRWLAVLYNMDPKDVPESAIADLRTEQYGWAKVKGKRPDVNYWYGSTDGFFSEEFSNPHQVDFEILLGRELSRSNAPSRDHPAFSSYESELRKVFESLENHGKATINYITTLQLGQMHDSPE